MTMQIRGDKIVFPDNSEQTTAFDQAAQQAVDLEQDTKINNNTTELTNKVEEAPEDGRQYARRNKGWQEVVSSGGGSDMTFAITDGLNTQTVMDGDNITFTGRTNEIDAVVSATDTLTIGLPNDVTVQGNITVAGNEINNQRITEWNTAHSWGNHADAGYLTETTEYVETDPVFTASPAGSITTGNITAWDQAHGWGDHSSENYLTDYTETDPVFKASAAYTITTGNITSWNTAHSWGDHSSENYLKEYTETDPVFTAHISSSITTGNITAWDQAHSWGNHADSNYLTDYTETNNLTESVTWANVPDSNITLSSVKQHQGNLDIAWTQVTDTPTTIEGYGITDNLQGTVTGDIDLNSYELVDTSQSDTPTFKLSHPYVDPVSTETSYVAEITGGDLHITQDKADPNLLYMKNNNAGPVSTSEFRMENENNFGFMAKCSGGYSHPLFDNVDPNTLFFGNFNGDIVVATQPKGIHETPSCFKVRSGLGTKFGDKDEDSLRIMPDGDAYFDAGSVTVNGGDLILGRAYKETVDTDSLPSEGVITINPANGSVQEVELTGVIELMEENQSMESGQTVTIVLKNSDQGSLLSDFKWAGGNKTLSTYSGSTDIITVSNLNGTYYASLANGFE